MYKHNLRNSSFVVFSVCGFRAAHSVLNNQSGGSFPREANSLLSNHCFVTCSPMCVEGDPLKISPFPVNMPTDIATVLIFVNSHFYERLFHSGFPGVLALTIFLPTLPCSSLSHGCRSCDVIC